MIVGIDNERNLANRLDFARNLARRVGLEALQFRLKWGVEALGIATKSMQDFVTDSDTRTEQIIRTELKYKFPGDDFIGEESGGDISSSGYWVVDPIDGTSNYLRGLKHWGVSMAYVQDGATALGVIYDAPNDCIYHAQSGGGAMCGDRSINTSNTENPHMALGILGTSRRTTFELYLDQLRSLHNAGIEYRKMGSAAIGIVRVAEGVMDFYYERHLNCWDALAAVLIAKEAGAEVITPPLDKFIKTGGEVFCSTPMLSHQLQQLLLGRVTVPKGSACQKEENDLG